MFRLRRWVGAGMVCVLAVGMLGANASGDPEARFGRIGHNLMCVCGCGQVLLDCNHVGCPDSERMIGELHGQVGGGGGASSSGAGSGGAGGFSGGGADSQVLNWFVAKYGASVLAAPIRGGFDNVAWIIPIVTFILATLGTALLVRVWSGRRQRLAVVSGLPAMPFADDAVRERIRRETDSL